jgi:2-methylcitrate dehydratase
MPLLVKKFEANLASRLSPAQCKQIMELCNDATTLQSTAVDKFMDMFVVRPGDPSSV